MEFGFVVGRHSLTNGTEKVIGGFLKIETAKDYADIKEGDYLTNGYMYIDTEEGRYILGVDWKEKDIWYSPTEKAYVYDSSKDCGISLEL